MSLRGAVAIEMRNPANPRLAGSWLPSTPLLP